jgi:hypothetical protein
LGMSLAANKAHIMVKAFSGQGHWVVP